MIYSLLTFPLVLLASVPSSYGAIPSVRPPTSMRTYVSPVIDNLLESLSPLLMDQDVAVSSPPLD
jgi:hypothetical protein